MLGLYIGIILLLNIPYVQHRMSVLVAKELSTVLGSELTVGRINIGLLNRIIIDDLVLNDQSGKELLKIGRLSAKFEILPLFSGKISIGNVQLFSFNANLERPTPQASTNFQFVLDAFGLEYLQTIAFILVIAALVQMVEIILKKVSPALYQALGVFLPLITTNCCILGVAILVIQKDFDLLTGVVYAFSTALGFALAMVLFAGIREQLSLVNIPKGMQGMAIALVTAGLLAMAFMGFSGVDKGLGVLFGIE